MEMRDNKGRFAKGGQGFWLGKRRPGLKTSTTWGRGNTPWNKGKHGEYKLKVDRRGKRFNTGKTHFPRGATHPFWKGGKTHDRDGYVITRVDGKPKREHIYVMEKYLGRRLDGDECVHHKDGNIIDNSLENLLLMKKSDHSKLHHLLLHHHVG